MKTWHIAVFVLFAAVALTAVVTHRRASDAADASAEQGTDAPAPVASVVSQRPLKREPKLAVAFRLDPSLTQSHYLGERWVSPPSFHFAQPGKQYVVEAKLQAIDSQGQRIDLRGDWTVTDPEMVAIAPGDHGQVTLTVRREGESRVAVAAGGETRTLQVRAELLPDAMEVAITQ